MRTCKEGKLLARAAAFYHPGGTERITGPTYSALNISCYAKAATHRAPVLVFRFAPIRVREKRMNTHKTAKTLRSYQKIRE
jgi:hypothetical protein